MEKCGRKGLVLILDHLLVLVENLTLRLRVKNVTHGFVKGSVRNQRGYLGIRLENVFQSVPLTVVV